MNDEQRVLDHLTKDFDDSLKVINHKINEPKIFGIKEARKTIVLEVEVVSGKSKGMRKSIVFNFNKVLRALNSAEKYG